jgi:hypothetical protein
MPAQQREMKKNYIGLVNDKIEQQRGKEPPARPGRPLKDYILGLLDAVLDRHGDAG